MECWEQLEFYVIRMVFKKIYGSQTDFQKLNLKPIVTSWYVQ